MKFSTRYPLELLTSSFLLLIRLLLLHWLLSDITLKRRWDPLYNQVSLSVFFIQEANWTSYIDNPFTPALPVMAFLALTLLISMVNANIMCIYSRDANSLKINGRSVVIDHQTFFDLPRTPRTTNLFRSIDPNKPYPVMQQVIITDSGAIVTNAPRIRDILMVFRIDFRSAPSLFITQDTTGTGTCDLNLQLNPHDIVKVTAFYATRPPPK